MYDSEEYYEYHVPMQENQDSVNLEDKERFFSYNQEQHSQTLYPGQSPMYPPFQQGGPSSDGPSSQSYHQHPTFQQGGPTSPPPYQQYPSHQHGGPSSGGAPTSPPPSIVPQQGPELKAVDPGSIRGCLFRYTYVWPRFGFPYWFYPTYVGRKSVSGYRWNGYRWLYFGTDLRGINSFSCY
ncbi:transporter [Mycoplasmatota bacterium WC44]